MNIIDTFATHITDRIEPVVKVADRNPSRLLYELSNLIVTPQWEQHLRRIFDAWAEASDSRAGVDPGIWISGFFGSGKSLLMKVLGIVLEGNELDGQHVDDIFLSRLPEKSPDRNEIKRLLTAIRRKTTTSSVGGNIHALQGSSNESLALIAFKLFADEQGYTRNWAFAWGVEYYIDQADKQQEFQRRAEQLTGKSWSRLQRDTAFNIDKLMQAAADVLPDHFEGGRDSVQRTINAVTQAGITPNDVVERLVSWCRSRDADGRRHRVLLQLDEIGQWIASGDSNERIMQVQAMVETAAVRGEGRVWMAVTAHGDIQALRDQVNVQQEQYAKINQRFSQKIKLSNDDMSHVVEERLLQKNDNGRKMLAARFAAHTGQIADLGSLKNPQRVYPAPTEELFPLCYPYLPWTVHVIPDVVKGVAQAAGRGDALTGATRTMISVVQGAILDTPGLLQAPIGRLLNVVDLYPQLVVDVPVETKTDLNSIPTKVLEATEFTHKVAIALYLVGQAQYIPCTLENLSRALVSNLDDNLAALGARIEPELHRLIEAGYVKQVGDAYEFLTTQQRTFQAKVREHQKELRLNSPALSQALKEFETDDLFQLAQLQAQGRPLRLRLLMDGRQVQPGQSRVTIHILTPIQRALDQHIADDEALRQRSNQEQETFFLRMDEARPLRDALSLFIATREIADRVIAANPASPEAAVARDVKVRDLSSLQTAVRNQLRAAMRGAQIFFRGSSYYPSGGSGDAVRGLLTQLLPLIYSRLGEVQHKVANVEIAVRAALNGTFSNMDIQLLNVLNNDGNLNMSSPLLSTIRGSIPLEGSDRPTIEAIELRRLFEDPPYGWDGGAIQVALALMLRGGACKLVIDGKPVTDPQHPDVQLALAKETRFKQLRVYGVRSELDSQQVIAARGIFETLFGYRPPLVAATLNSKLGEELAGISTRCAALHQWATAAGFPLPAEFSAGESVVGELIANANPVTRLPLFVERYQQLSELLDLLDTLEQFRQNSGATFQKIRDYFNSMINANLPVLELQTFLRNFNTLQSERRFYDRQRWQDLVSARDAAETAVTAQLARWVADAGRRAQQTIAGIPDQLRDIGATEAQIEEHAPRLQQPFDQLLAELPEQPTVAAASPLRSRLDMLDLNLRGELERLREQFNPPAPPPRGGGKKVNDGGPSIPYGGIQLRDFVPEETITTIDELDAALEQIRTEALAALERFK
jgi:hypothetical protein